MAGATIYDVAARAGVSIKTVSRVVNREANVSRAMRERVEEAVIALGYRRSLSARALAGSNSTIIAALVDAELTIEHWKSGRGNDYLSRLELGALMECRQAEYHLMVELVDHGSAHLERDMQALLGSIRPAGVLLTPPNSDHALVLDILDAAGVAYARISPEKDLARGVSVRMDERQAAFDMTRHLIDLGHRRIAHISGPATYAASSLRREGYEQALKQAGVAPSPSLIVEGDFTFASGIAGIERLLSGERPTAVFAANDDMALGVLQGAAAAGVSVPLQLSVAGFDDTPSALFSTPPLTTIRQPVAEMAAEATRRLLPAMGQDNWAEADPVVVVPYYLVVRGSTAVCP
ncbi:MAG: LacI family DNA-binding transcriptional regulator [Brevundimonas sp.]|uniref:LacI family DNA-binding transcriptional regulator n=1 Tax=Brevundimonas sp. TaxID=1871086 RepID=UPI00300374F4